MAFNIQQLEHMYKSGQTVLCHNKAECELNAERAESLASLGRIASTVIIVSAALLLFLGSLTSTVSL
jgi:hypothetical protein